MLRIQSFGIHFSRHMFTVGSILGSGNFGSVYVGEASGLIHPDSKTKVAIKTVNDVLDLAQLQVREKRDESKEEKSIFF